MVETSAKFVRILEQVKPLTASRVFTDLLSNSPSVKIETNAWENESRGFSPDCVGTAIKKIKLSFKTIDTENYTTSEMSHVSSIVHKFDNS